MSDIWPLTGSVLELLELLNAGSNTTGSGAPATCWPSATRRSCWAATDNRRDVCSYSGTAEQGTKTEIVATYMIKLDTLKVFSQRGISLRKGGPLPSRTKLLLPDAANGVGPPDRSRNHPAFCQLEFAN